MFSETDPAESMNMDHLKQLGITVAGALIALTIGWTGYTMYQDHIFIEALKGAVQQQQAQRRPPEMPQPAPSTAAKK